MNKSLLSILAIVSCFFLSCVKEEQNNGPTTVEGIVKDAVSMKAVPEAAVYLTRTRKGDVGAMSTQGIGKVIGDEDGKFKFNFDAEQDYYYEICARKEHYNENGICATARAGQNNNNVEVRIQPYGWIKFNIINEPPLDYVDLAMSVHNFFKLYNFNGDTIIYSKMLSGVNQITWVVYHNGIGDKFTDKLNLSPLDTLEYTIKY